MTDRELKKRLKDFRPKVWHPFDRETYRQEWRGKKMTGVFQQFCRDFRYSRQRVFKGYCDYDLFSIYDWFLEIIRPMLLEFKETRHGSPVQENSLSQAVFLGEKERDQDIHKNWDAVLDRLIFLFGEADEASCSRDNPYTDDYMKAFNAVWERTKEEEPGKHVVHFPDEFPEYRELAENYNRAEKELIQYRKSCKDEAFRLFSKWFYDLWD